MTDGGSKRKKKKRGKSLIFKNFFKPATSGDDPSSGPEGKILASDDNLVYCDINGNCVDPDIKKSSSRGRMSRIFKAVLFDTAVKKNRGTNSSETPIGSESTSPVHGEKFETIENIEKIEKIDNSIDDNKSNILKESEVDHSSTDRSDQIELSSRSAAPPVSSSPVPPTTTGSQTLTERKANPVDKKPPLPSNPRPPAKQVPVEDTKPVPVNNTTDFRLFILLGLVVLVVALWMR